MFNNGCQNEPVRERAILMLTHVVPPSRKFCYILYIRDTTMFNSYEGENPEGVPRILYQAQSVFTITDIYKEILLSTT